MYQQIHSRRFAFASSDLRYGYFFPIQCFVAEAPKPARTLPVIKAAEIIPNVIVPDMIIPIGLLLPPTTDAEILAHVDDNW